LRIAVNASILGLEPTGVNIYTEQVLTRLFRLPDIMTHQIEVFTPRALDLPDSVTQHILDGNLGRSTQVKGNALRRFLWNQMQFTRIGKQFDRIYCPSYNTSLTLPNQIITIHDLIAMRLPAQHPLQHAYCRFALPAQLRRARAIVAISESTRLELTHWFGISPSAIQVVPNGYDPVRFHPAHSPEDSGVIARHGLVNFVLMVGATFPHKNIEVVLNAIGTLAPRLANHSLLQNHPPLQVAIVGGENAYQRELRQAVLNLGLGNQVKFLGYVPDNDLPALYRKAQCLAYPSLLEGFGLPILDAMASGCPVICSNTSSLPEVAGNAALLCAPTDTLAWAESIFQISTEPQTRAKFVAQGLERVKHFSWQATAEKIAGILLRD
jgi:glycosyltransferase involved in cell wall biosynthesis